MSGLRDLRDLNDDDLSEEARRQIDGFIRRGFDRDHLVVNAEGRVFFDRELSENQAFDELIFDPKRRNN